MTQIQTERLESALLYATLGWPVLPCHTPDANGVCDCPRREACPSPGKDPRTRNGLDDASTDEATIRRWWGMWPHANLAIHLERAGLVDIAPDSLEWFAEFTARGLPPTPHFASGGGEGHAHHLYARPEGCPSYRVTESGKYDVLSAGYAIMPPSTHRSQQIYTWLDGTPLTPPTVLAPAWSVDMLSRRRESLVRAPEGLFTSDGPPVELRGDGLDRWQGRLVDRKPDGEVDRSRSLWALAVVLLEAGCQPAYIERYLAERDETLGWLKFSSRTDGELRYHVIVERALVGQGPARITINRQAPITTESVEWLTGAQLVDIEDEDIAWVSPGWLGRGLLTELDGKVKQSGKTTFTLALVRAILERDPFLGQPTSYCPILYLTEQSGPSFKRNIARAGLLGHEDLHILFWSKVAGWKWPQVVQEGRRKAREIGAGLLVVDTLGQFSGVRGDAENSSGSAMEIMGPLQAAASDGLGVLLSRHDRKSGGDVGDSGRGSSAYAGAVDIVLHLQRLPGDRPGKERQRLLDGISRFEETPEKLLIELQPGNEGEPYSYRAIGDAAEVRREQLRVEILAHLPTDRDLAPTAPELKESLQVSPQDLLRELWELMKEHLVVRSGDGKRGSPWRYHQPVYEED